MIALCATCRKRRRERGERNSLVCGWRRSARYVRDRRGEADPVAWSKGAFAPRLYVSSVAPSWGRPYQDNVARLILMGNPNGGLDYTFTHGTEGNPQIYPECGGSFNGPSPSQSYVCFVIFYSELNLSINSAYFTGQRQMMGRRDTARLGYDLLRRHRLREHEQRHPERHQQRLVRGHHAAIGRAGFGSHLPAVRRVADHSGVLQREPRPDRWRSVHRLVPKTPPALPTWCARPSSWETIT
jgi:hypothetical protein